MTPADLRTLFAALKFTAVVMKGHHTHNDGTRNVLGNADLIEVFCNYTTPHLGAAVNENEIYQLDDIIEKLKA
jgi:hypothetical protein